MNSKQKEKFNLLEAEKIALTKQYEQVQEEINYYNIDNLSFGAWPFKELIYKRDRILNRINEIKKILDVI